MNCLTYKEKPMAKVQTKIIVLKFSKLVKNDADSDMELASDISKTLEDVAQQMCEDSSIIVEAELVDE